MKNKEKKKSNISPDQNFDNSLKDNDLHDSDYKLSSREEKKYLDDAVSILKNTQKSWRLKDLVDKVMKINNINEFDFSTKAKILVAIRWNDRFIEFDQERIKINPEFDLFYDTQFQELVDEDEHEDDEFQSISTTIDDEDDEDDEIDEYFHDEDIIDFSHLKIDESFFLDDMNQFGFINSYIYLGRYPQTIVSDSFLITELENTYNSLNQDLIEIDGNKYIRVKAVNIDEEVNFSNGQIPIDGEIYFFKIEPVKWRLLLRSGNKYMLTTEKLLLASKYDDNIYVKFENSYIRKTIIPELLTEIFGIKTDKCTFLHEDDIKSSELWTEENNKLWINNRVAFPTDFAISQGAYSDESGGLYWGFVDNFGTQSSIIGSGTMWANDYVIESDVEFPVFDVCIRPVVKIKFR
ncbi:MAG TPA: hypothetical protein PLJ98_07095 [Acholeplasmataceae bacterium]|nr:hypothetical protein [Acholeplasmataceae bacterium]